MSRRGRRWGGWGRNGVIGQIDWRPAVAPTCPQTGAIAEEAAHALAVDAGRADNDERCWSVDFMHNGLTSGWMFRTFNVIDDFNREALATKIDTSLPAVRVIRVLDALAAWRGYPKRLRSDNEPGKPAQNAYIEPFNRTYREEVLDLYLFDNLAEARAITEAWLEEYNAIRPHESLGGLTLYRYAAEVGLY
jgi:transposase InsO family protein